MTPVAIVRFYRERVEDEAIARDNYKGKEIKQALLLQFDLELQAHTRLHRWHKVIATQFTKEVMTVWCSFTLSRDWNFQKLRSEIQTCYDEHGMSGMFEIIDFVPEPEDMPKALNIRV